MRCTATRSPKCGPEMATQSVPAPYGVWEAMTMTTAKNSAKRIAELLEAAWDEDAAVGALDGCVARLRRARAAQAALAQLDTADLRAVLDLRPTDLTEGGQ